MMVALADTPVTPRPDVAPHGARPLDRAHSPAEMAAHRGQICHDMCRRVVRWPIWEAKLSLTQAQAPLFASWKEATLSIARRHADQRASKERPEAACRRRWSA